MSRQSVKDTLLNAFAAVAKAAAHPHRFAILEHLAQGERTVEGLADRTGLSVANASQHLQSMRRAGLLAARRDGKFTLHRLSDDSVLDLMHAINRVAERNGLTPRSVSRRASRQFAANVPGFRESGP